MANPTSNFGWQMPTPTDLVTDLPADFEVFGQAVDTSLADLKGGSTGQVLSKNSNTDMDFVWVAQDDSNAIQNSIVDAKGDLIAATAADTPARLAVGANDLLLTAASGEATGLKYTGAWTSYTPTLTNLTLGNGTVVAKYAQIGKTVNLYFKFTLGSTSAVTGNPTFTLPINCVNETIAPAYIQDVGTNNFYGIMTLGSTTGVIVMQNVAGTYPSFAAISATVPMTWTTNDYVYSNITYEVA